jgi:hypothetical protein
MSPLEILNGALMLFGGRTRAERPQISAFAGLGVHFPGVQAVFTRFQFPNHAKCICSFFTNPFRLLTRAVL